MARVPPPSAGKRDRRPIRPGVAPRRCRDRRSGSRPRRPSSPGARAALAWMLRKTSAFWLLAYADRSSSVIVRSSSRVRKTRRPSRLSIIVSQPAGDGQRDVLLERAARAARAGLVAAVAGVDHDRAHARRGRRQRERRQCRRRERCRRRGAAVASLRSPAGSSSMTRRDVFASGCDVVARWSAELRAGHEPDGCGRLAGLHRLQKLLRRHGGQRRVERVGLEQHDQRGRSRA